MDNLNELFQKLNNRHEKIINLLEEQKSDINCLLKRFDNVLKQTNHKNKTINSQLSKTECHSYNADFSNDEKYRYLLYRYFNDKKNRNLLLWVCLNPSNADVDMDDPTVRNIIKITKNQLNNYDGFILVNLFAYRKSNTDNLSKKPKYLTQDDIDFGPENIQKVQDAINECSNVVYAWGHHLPVPNWLKLINDKPTYTYKLNKDSTPAHPGFTNITEINQLTPWN